MYTVEEIRQQVKLLDAEQPWWHDLDLGNGIRTLGRQAGELKENHDRVKWARFADYFNWHDKSVLDVGCNEGFYSFEIARRGAAHVRGIDIDPLRIKKALFAQQVTDARHVTFECLDVFGLLDASVKRHDFVLCLGILHRVPNPFGLIQTLAKLGHTIVLEWPALAAPSADARFWGGGYKNDFYNTGYWELTRKCTLQILKRCGIPFVVDIAPYEKRALFICSDRESLINDVRAKLVRPPLSRALSYRWRMLRNCARSLLLLASSEVKE